jgi:hypothetical protein
MRSLLKECSGCRRLLALVAAGLCGLVLASPAKADFNTDITVGDSVLSAFPTPYGALSVSLNQQNLNTATVTFQTYLARTPYAYFLTDTTAMAFNVNAASWSIVVNSFDCSNPTAGCPYSHVGAVNTTFGSFNDSINLGSSTPDARTSIFTFTLTRTDGGTWADALSVFTPNSSGFAVAEHVGVCHFAECQDAPTQYIANGFDALGTGLPPPVTIQINPPAKAPVPINLKSEGVTPVAILSTPGFDATQVNPATIDLSGAPVRSAGGGQFSCSAQDVNGDGLPDLVCQIITDQLKLGPTSTQALLTGMTFSGAFIQGTATIRVVGN